MEYEKLLKKLKELRKMKKISCREIAEAMGKTRGYIYYLESGKTELKLKEYLKICEILEISPRELLDGSYPREFYNTTAEQLENLSNRDFLIIKHLLSLMESPVEIL